MNEAEGLNFSVGLPAEQGDAGRRKPRHPGLRHNSPSLDDILSFIDRLSITKGDKEVLYAAAKRTPHGALANFRSNYMLYLRKGGRR